MLVYDVSDHDIESFLHLDNWLNEIDMHFNVSRDVSLASHVSG